MDSPKGTELGPNSAEMGGPELYTGRWTEWGAWSLEKKGPRKPMEEKEENVWDPPYLRKFYGGIKEKKNRDNFQSLELFEKQTDASSLL